MAVVRHKEDPENSNHGAIAPPAIMKRGHNPHALRSFLLSHEEVFFVHVGKHTKDIDALGRRGGGDERELPGGIWAVEI